MLSKLRFIFGVLLMGALAASSSPKVDQNTAARRDLDNSGAQTGAQTGAIGADRGQEAAPDRSMIPIVHWRSAAFILGSTAMISRRKINLCCCSTHVT